MPAFSEDHYHEDRFNDELLADSLKLKLKLIVARNTLREILNIIEQYPHIGKNVYVGLIAHKAEEALKATEAI